MNLPPWVNTNTDLHMERELKECAGKVLISSEPELGLPLTGVVDYSDIDVILVSNYLRMLALPYITEGTGFQGRIFMTEPTLQIGKLFMEEMVSYMEQAPKPTAAHLWRNLGAALPFKSADGKPLKPHQWSKLYTMKSVNAALAKVTMVGFSEHIDVFGAINVCAVSSGYCLGSCNWILSSDYER